MLFGCGPAVVLRHTKNKKTHNKDGILHQSAKLLPSQALRAGLRKLSIPLKKQAEMTYTRRDYPNCC